MGSKVRPTAFEPLSSHRIPALPELMGSKRGTPPERLDADGVRFMTEVVGGRVIYAIEGVPRDALKGVRHPRMGKGRLEIVNLFIDAPLP